MGVIPRSSEPGVLHTEVALANPPVHPDFQLSEEIRVLVERQGHAGDSFESFDPMQNAGSLQRLRLRLKGTGKEVIVHRKEEPISKDTLQGFLVKAGEHCPARIPVAEASFEEALDIFLTLDDIESVDAEFRNLVGNLVGKCKADDTDKLSPKSALTAYFVGLKNGQQPQSQARSTSKRLGASDGQYGWWKPDKPKCSKQPVTEEEASCLASASEPAAMWVVHLRVRPTASIKVNQLQDGRRELCITASKADTADSVRRKAEAQGLPAYGFDVVFNGCRLSSFQPLVSYGVSKGSVLELVPVEGGIEELPASSPPLSSPQHALFPEWQKAKAGLASGRAPKLAPAGTGGSYFLLDEDGHDVAVFKPADEEPLAVNNPKGNHGTSLDGHGLRKGICPGEGAIREVAAYLLDHDHFSGVPPTALVACERPVPGGGSCWKDGKVGSLQAYIKADSDCEEKGYSVFPATEVAKIAVLDIRLANTDRNGSNILVSTEEHGAVRLTPIDHGYCLPSTLQDICFEWLYWPQALLPFTAETASYIAKLDADADLALLEAHGLCIRRECARIFRACTLLLKMGAARGMTPFQIGSVMCRDPSASMDESLMEQLHARALLSVGGNPDPSDRAYLAALCTELDCVLVWGLGSLYGVKSPAKCRGVYDSPSSKSCSAAISCS